MDWLNSFGPLPEGLLLVRFPSLAVNRNNELTGEQMIFSRNKTSGIVAGFHVPVPVIEGDKPERITTLREEGIRFVEIVDWGKLPYDANIVRAFRQVFEDKSIGYGSQTFSEDSKSAAMGIFFGFTKIMNATLSDVPIGTGSGMFVPTNQELWIKDLAAGYIDKLIDQVKTLATDKGISLDPLVTKLEEILAKATNDTKEYREIYFDLKKIDVAPLLHSLDPQTRGEVKNALEGYINKLLEIDLKSENLDKNLPKFFLEYFPISINRWGEDDLMRYFETLLERGSSLDNLGLTKEEIIKSVILQRHIINNPRFNLDQVLAYVKDFKKSEYMYNVLKLVVEKYPIEELKKEETVEKLIDVINSTQTHKILFISKGTNELKMIDSERALLFSSLIEKLDTTLVQQFKDEFLLGFTLPDAIQEITLAMREKESHIELDGLRGHFLKYALLKNADAVTTLSDVQKEELLISSLKTNDLNFLLNLDSNALSSGNIELSNMSKFILESFTGGSLGLDLVGIIDQKFDEIYKTDGFQAQDIAVYKQIVPKLFSLVKEYYLSKVSTYNGNPDTLFDYDAFKNDINAILGSLPSDADPKLQGILLKSLDQIKSLFLDIPHNVEGKFKYLSLLYETISDLAPEVNYTDGDNIKGYIGGVLKELVPLHKALDYAIKSNDNVRAKEIYDKIKTGYEAIPEKIRSEFTPDQLYKIDKVISSLLKANRETSDADYKDLADKFIEELKLEDTHEKELDAVIRDVEDIYPP